MTATSDPIVAATGLILQTSCLGRGQAKQSPQLAEAVSEILAGDGSSPICGRQLREAVRRLRLRGCPVCSDSRAGYWWAETPEELDLAMRYLRSKAMSSLQQISLLRRQTRAELGGQLRLDVGQAPLIVDLPIGLLQKAQKIRRSQGCQSVAELIAQVLSTYVSAYERHLDLPPTP